VPNAPSTRFEVVPGGHLGMLTGRASRRTTWRIIDEFLDEHASDADETRREGRAPTEDPRARQGRRGDARAQGTKGTPRADAIGANPSRRYGSGSSRSLASGS
jgi:polyhydroxyalkanoate synthase subunit PhaC